MVHASDNEIDPHQIASRIRGLIGGQDNGVIEATARRLRVSEVALRISVDPIEPHPVVEVIVALVKELGIDPSWLLTGDYDSTAHRAVIGDDDLSRSAMAKLISARLTPAHGEPAGKPNLRLEA